MKKTCLVLIAVLVSVSLFAQTLYLEGKGGVKSTWLFNKNVSDDGNEQDYAAAWGSNYGLGASMYFNKSVGLGIDFLLNNHNAAYTGEFDSTDYTSHVWLNTIDIPLMFKLKSGNGGFLEVGMQYSTVGKATYSTNVNVTLPNSQIAKFDTTYNADTSYANSNISIVLGFGIQIKFTDRIGLNLGFRFEYGLSDLEGLDGFGNDLKNFYYGPSSIYPKYEKTGSASAAFMGGIYFKLGSEKDSTVP